MTGSGWEGEEKTGNNSALTEFHQGAKAQNPAQNGQGKSLFFIEVLLGDACVAHDPYIYNICENTLTWERIDEKVRRGSRERQDREYKRKKTIMPS